MSTEKISTREETLIWEGSQSQLLNLGNYILIFLAILIITSLAIMFLPPPANMILLAVNIIPLAYILYKFIIIRSVKYRITDQRVVCSTGIFSKKTDAIELYRVKDLEVYQPFWMRLFKYGNLTLITHDTSHPNFTVKAIPRPLELYDRLRIAVEKRRDEKRVRGVEFDSDEFVS
jgi:uncharacterized membrane protein YdbT with pleckstrin-like domain